MLEGGESGEWRELPTTLRDSLTARLARLGHGQGGGAARLGDRPRLLAPAARGRSPRTPSTRSSASCASWCSRGWCTGAASAPRRATRSSTRWSATPPTTRCCGASASRSTCASPPRWRRRSAAAPTAPRARRSPTTTWPASSTRRRSSAGSRPASWRSAARPTPKRSPICSTRCEALDALPPSPDRDRREIALRSMLAMSLGVIRGLSAPEVEAVYDRILTLTGQVGDVPLGIYFGLWNFYASRGKLQRAPELGQQRLAYGEAPGDAESRAASVSTPPPRPISSSATSSDARDGFEHAARRSTRATAWPTRRSPTTSASSRSRSSATRCGCSARPEAGDARRPTRRSCSAARFSPFTQSVALVNRMILATSMRRRRDQPPAGAGADRAQLRALLPGTGWCTGASRWR